MRNIQLVSKRKHTQKGLKGDLQRGSFGSHTNSIRKIPTNIGSKIFK